jgi:hypothetical protein
MIGWVQTDGIDDLLFGQMGAPLVPLTAPRACARLPTGVRRRSYKAHPSTTDQGGPIGPARSRLWVPARRAFRPHEGLQPDKFSSGLPDTGRQIIGHA